MKIFGREPALVLAFVAALIQMVSSFVFPLSVDQQGVLNALTVAIIGVVTALAVRGDQAAPAILGFIKAALAVGLAFGFHLAPEAQSTIMVFAAAVVAMFVRTQVIAPVQSVVSS